MLSAILKWDTSLSWCKCFKSQSKRQQQRHQWLLRPVLWGLLDCAAWEDPKLRDNRSASKAPSGPCSLREPSGKEGALPGALVRALPFKCFQGVQATMRAAEWANRVWHMRRVWHSSLHTCSCRQVTEPIKHSIGMEGFRLFRKEKKGRS